MPDEGLLQEEAEHVLVKSMQKAREDVEPLLAERNYTESLKRFAELRAPVDAYFDDVMVMTEDEALRNNRLATLQSLREMFLDVADISRLTPDSD